MKTFNPVTPLTRKRLDELLAYFEDLENINDYRFLGKISKGKKNPNYIVVTDSNRNSMLTARITMRFPVHNHYSKLGFSIFTTGETAALCQATLDTKNVQYIAGRGRIQNHTVLNRAGYNPAFVELVKNTIAELGKGEKEFKIIFKTLDMSYEERMPTSTLFTTVWSNHIADGTSIAEALQKSGRPPQINKAEVQGLLFMPPSLRYDPRREANVLHFRLRIKREMDDPDQPVPELFQATHDYVNVLCSGEYAEYWFERLRGLQGYPVHVVGRMEGETYSYSPEKTTQKWAYQIASALQCATDHPCVRKIIGFLRENHLDDRSRPTYNIWTNDISTQI